MKTPKSKLPTTASISTPRPDRFWLRWSLIVLVGYAPITYFTIRTYEQDRYQRAHRVGPEHYLPLSKDYYRGTHVIIGWPTAWLGLRYEATDVSPRSSQTLVHVKTSIPALVLDVLLVVSVILAGVQFVHLRRGPFVPWRAVLLLLCLAFLASAVFWGPHNFLGRLPVYPQDFVSQ